MEKLILSLGLCLTLAALGLNRPVLALPTRLGADELPPRYYVYEAKVSGDGKRGAQAHNGEEKNCVPKRPERVEQRARSV